jgi:hypothetical protein
LIDLSQPMHDRARERVSRATAGRSSTVQAYIDKYIGLARRQLPQLAARLRGWKSSSPGWIRTSDLREVGAPAGAAALVLGCVPFALGGALSRRWARDELLRRVERLEGPRKPERHGNGIRGDVSAFANQRGADRRPDRQGKHGVSGARHPPRRPGAALGRREGSA